LFATVLSLHAGHTSGDVDDAALSPL
jgi:hypothetical protein